MANTLRTDREIIYELYDRVEKLEQLVKALQSTTAKVDKRTIKDIVFGSAGRNRSTNG